MSIFFLCLQVMIFICDDTLKQFNKTIFNKKGNRKAVISTGSYDYKNKMAK